MLNYTHTHTHTHTLPHARGHARAHTHNHNTPTGFLPQQSKLDSNQGPGHSAADKGHQSVL